mmetsp:Transcript_148/g.537  ORF Transcript_148/g.537 Transcript_148/m.537 type:complete len:196 (-) Transcript_148:61-648(-)
MLPGTMSNSQTLPPSTDTLSHINKLLASVQLFPHHIAPQKVCSNIIEAALEGDAFALAFVVDEEAIAQEQQEGMNQGHTEVHSSKKLDLSKQNAPHGQVEQKQTQCRNQVEAPRIEQQPSGGNHEDHMVDSPNSHPSKDAESSLCQICMENQKNVVLLPCGHIPLCIQCSETSCAQMTECPLCRSPILSRHKVFT